jgi:hypothetical protein
MATTPHMAETQESLLKLADRIDAIANQRDRWTGPRDLEPLMRGAVGRVGPGHMAMPIERRRMGPVIRLPLSKRPIRRSDRRDMRL